MKYGLKYLSIFLSTILIFSACAQYKRPVLMVKVPDFYDHKTKIHLMTLVADPYFEDSRMQYLFNNNLLEKGYLPIHFIAFNFGEQTYDLSQAKFTLVRDDGTLLEPLEPNDVAKKVLKHTSLRMIGWGFAGLIILSIPFSLVAGIDSYRANKKTREAVTKDTLKVFEIGPKEVVDGFYFFHLGNRSKEIKEALTHQHQLRIQGLKDETDDRVYEFQIGIS